VEQAVTAVEVAAAVAAGPVAVVADLMAVVAGRRCQEPVQVGLQEETAAGLLVAAGLGLALRLPRAVGRQLVLVPREARMALRVQHRRLGHRAAANAGRGELRG